MALVRCPDCGRDVSTEALACLGCGRPMKSEASPMAAPPVINCPPVIGDRPITVDEPRQTSHSRSSNRNLMVWLIVIGAALAVIASWPKGSAPQPVPRPSEPVNITANAAAMAQADAAVDAANKDPKVQARRKAEDAELKAWNEADAGRDLQVVKSTWKKGGFDTVAIWSVTIRNLNKVASFADIAYSTSYSGASGTVLAAKKGIIFDVLKAGKTRTFEVNDGFVDGQVQRAGFELTGAKRTR
jgi:hypothetical protein